LFDRRQDAQTRLVLTVPASRTRTDRKLGSQRRRVLRMEWLTLFPDAGPLPHTSHRLATKSILSAVVGRPECMTKEEKADSLLY
jgi:hypothetical protein